MAMLGSQCDPCCGCRGTCCINGSLDPTKKTQAECVAAGGTWKPPVKACFVNGAEDTSLTTQAACTACRYTCTRTTGGGSVTAPPTNADYQLPQGESCPPGTTMVMKPSNVGGFGLGPLVPYCVGTYCPEGFTLQGNTCVKAGSCPPGFTDNMQGSCVQTTTVETCDDCTAAPGITSSCSKNPTSGYPCGAWKNKCLPCGCQSDSDCPAGQCCVNGQCAPCPPPPDVCTVPCYQGFDPCPPGCVCCNGRCVREITCEMPSQITMSLSGMKRLFLWSSQNAGTPFGGFLCQPNGQGQPEGDKVFCDQCDEPEAYLRGVGSSAGISGYSGSLITQNFSNVVLDRVSEDACSMTYQGFAPGGAFSSAVSGSPRNVDCDTDEAVQVHISPLPAGVDVAVEGNASATATVSNDGAISGITVTNGGSGYAHEIMQRLEPSITASITSGTGSGATLTVTLMQNGQGGQATWSVSSVSVTNGGTGYSGSEFVTFTPGAGVTTAIGAWAQLIVGRVAPTVTASVSSGSGGELSVTLAQGFAWWTNQNYWYVESVSVVEGGSGYEDGEQVVFTVTDGTSQSAATATVATGRSQPDVTAEVVLSAGTGAVLTPTLTAIGNAWSVSGLTITNAGSGYAQWEVISFATNDVTESYGDAYITSVDGNGGITGVAIGYGGGGSYYRSTGEIVSVYVSGGGEYFKSTGIVESVQVFDGGSYYKEQGTGQVAVNTPAVRIFSNTGFGATATATVDDTLGSPTFGQVTSISVDNGGQNYYTEGSAWLVSISVGGFFHLQTLSIANQTQAPHGRLLPIAGRVSRQACPTELLNRSYTMFTTLNDPFQERLPEGFADYVVNEGWYSLTLFGFSGAITVSLSAG